MRRILPETQRRRHDEIVQPAIDQICQIASNSDPLFASNPDPSSAPAWGLSTSCIGGTRARGAALQALRGAEGEGQSRPKPRGGTIA
jgi:hypothetical protein